MKIAAVALGVLLCGIPAFPKQTQPDAKRVRQIQAALLDHGFKPGRTWAETQEICRGIARDHGWQTLHAPDARVLILIGLGNKNGNSDVITWGHDHLDGK